MHQEVTEDGHLYYLLDPKDERERPSHPRTQTSPVKSHKNDDPLPPPLPNNHPLSSSPSSSLSPSHAPNNINVHNSPSRPKAHSATAETKVSNKKKKNNSLGRLAEKTRR